MCVYECAVCVLRVVDRNQERAGLFGQVYLGLGSDVGIHVINYMSILQSKPRQDQHGMFFCLSISITLT